MKHHHACYLLPRKMFLRDFRLSLGKRPEKSLVKTWPAGVFSTHLVFVLFFAEADNMHDDVLFVLRSFMGEESR